MADRIGIRRMGAYLPLRRLDRATVAAAHAWANPGLKGQGRGTRAMASWDEDSVTMAVESARIALGAAGFPVSALTLASTTLPFADRLNAGIVATALDLGASIEAEDSGGSQRAATTALLRAFQAAGAHEAALVIGSEKRITKPASALELKSGDAAAAFVVGRGDDLIAELLGSGSRTADFVDHYREADEATDYVLEERWVRDEAVLGFVPPVVKALLERTGFAAAAIDHALFALPSVAMAKAAAKAIGINDTAVGDPLAARAGQAGAAHPLLLLVHALETAAEGALILLVGFGQGCDALLFRKTGAPAYDRPEQALVAQLAGGRVEDNYLRFLSFNGHVRYDWGIRSERDNRTAQTVAWRKSRDLYAFVGGKCSACGTVQFPKSRTCVNPACREMDRQEPYRLAETTATIKTFTDDWQAFHPDPPLRYGNIAFSEGGNALMEIADAPSGGLHIGQTVRMAFRVKDYDERRAFRRYFWKAVPVVAAGDAQ